VAPRVNAAGRLDDPTIAYRLLVAETFEEAFALAEEVDRLNSERKVLTASLEKTALERVAPDVAADAYTLVCGGDAWPQGIVGLVAGRLAQAHHRPALVYSVKDGVATGSGRSAGGFDLLGGLRGCDDLFLRYGGHHAAAGFTIAAERVPELKERFELIARESITAEQRRPVLNLDGYLKPDTISIDFARMLERLAPFGMGFTAPKFALRNMRVTQSQRVGVDGAHWRLRVRPAAGGPYVGAIYFGGGPYADQFPIGSNLDAAFTLERSFYNDQWRVEMHIQDVAPAA
jgi:single-stranded-DNA-specific exonuclease